MSKKLPVSRLQRDLTDSTVLRNVGTCFAYLLISITSICEGFKRIEPNLEKIKSDLNNKSIVLAEAIQSILRRESVDNSYDIIKSIICVIVVHYFIILVYHIICHCRLLGLLLLSLPTCDDQSRGSQNGRRQAENVRRGTLRWRFLLPERPLCRAEHADAHS